MEKRFRDVGRSRVMRIVHVVYDVVSVVFLGIAVVMATGVAFVFVRMPQIRARVEQYEAMEIQAENESFCEKRGLTPETYAFQTCEFDLDEIRANEDKRQASPLF